MATVRSSLWSRSRASSRSRSSSASTSSCCIRSSCCSCARCTASPPSSAGRTATSRSPSAPSSARSTLPKPLSPCSSRRTARCDRRSRRWRRLTSSTSRRLRSRCGALPSACVTSIVRPALSLVRSSLPFSPCSTSVASAARSRTRPPRPTRRLTPPSGRTCVPCAARCGTRWVERPSAPSSTPRCGCAARKTCASPGRRRCRFRCGATRWPRATRWGGGSASSC
mmetsp:Transcript_72901/g.200077  ORF Transcript_72901/g.200077 Transcript_72901/m.200077 type:complete len:225 (+) Transcript_72901:1121-1795(+)